MVTFVGFPFLFGIFEVTKKNGRQWFRFKVLSAKFLTAEIMARLTYSMTSSPPLVVDRANASSTEGGGVKNSRHASSGWGVNDKPWLLMQNVST